MKKFLNLKNPRTYTEKIQWLKLHNTNPLYTKLVDKYEVKNFIKEKIGEQYLIPLLGVWDHFDKIDFEKLPDKFVLKTNHDSGTVVVCSNKAEFNLSEARKKIQTALSKNYFYKSREYPYKNIKPKVFAETYLYDDEQPILNDYKFFCFHGEPHFLQITSYVGKQKFVDYFDINFNRLNFTTGSPSNPHGIKRPLNYEEMIDVTKILARDIIHVRIDLYNVNGKIYFGEFTFHSNGGIIKFFPPEWNKKLGDLIELPN
jgi:hypothetical protein